MMVPYEGSLSRKVAGRVGVIEPAPRRWLPHIYQKTFREPPDIEDASTALATVRRLLRLNVLYLDSRGLQ